MMGTRSGLKRGLTWGNAGRGGALLRRRGGARAGGQSAGRAKSRNRGGSGRPSLVSVCEDGAPTGADTPGLGVGQPRADVC